VVLAHQGDYRCRSARRPEQLAESPRIRESIESVVGLLLDPTRVIHCALTQRRQIERKCPRLNVSVNLAVGPALTAPTIAFAPLWPSFA
jgi:hypothetical protein